MSELEKPLLLNGKRKCAKKQEKYIHKYYNNAVCETDTKGHATPDGRSRTEIVLDATDGFIPLWAKDVTLRWRFQ